MVDARETRARAGVQLRADAGGDGYTLTGYASMFNTPYEVSDFLGSYTETVREGAFTKTLQERDDVRLLLNHDGVPLARTKSGTLTLSQDGTGLLCEARLDPASPLVASVKSAMDRGDLDQMSFAFSATRQEWSKDYSERTINEAKLFDVSVVTYPASPSTSASLRSESTASAETRAAAILERASRQMRAQGVMDDATRDLLLQLLGALDAACESLDDSTEVLEELLGVAPEADLSDAAELVDGEMDDMPQQNSSKTLWALRAAALDIH